MSGRVAIVLHTHMPYVEGYGVWPFGEEWLFEAVATSYVPLLEVLEAGAPLTLSVTPVLLDQLEAPGVYERLLAFLGELRPEVHRQAAAATPEGPLRDEIARAAGDYDRAAAAVRRLGDGGLAAALARHATWTSSATHAVLPLLATDRGIGWQVATGVASHRARHGGWGGGFWLPECAWAPWIDAGLAGAGVRTVVVDLTDHDHDPLRPLRTPAGVTAAPLHRPLVEQVWSDRGYPSGGAYRDYHNYVEHRRRPWAVDGTPYDPERAERQVRVDARAFAEAARREVAGGGLAVCAFDTELFGEWWYEGVRWLAAVAEELGDDLVVLDGALPAAPGDAAAAPLRAVSTWGTPRDLSTWSGPAVADLAWDLRRAELDAVAAGPGLGTPALRELLALQSSDWAFLASNATAGDYPRERAAGHLAAFRAALEDPRAEAGPRHLAASLRTAR